MHAEPDSVPTEGSDKFSIDFGGLGLGSGSNMACGGSPGACCHPRAGKSHPQSLLSQRPEGDVPVLE